MATELKPYVFFYGRCAEALEFYKGVFGGSYEAMRVGDSPMASQMPPGSENKVMHASFTADGIAFFASDGMEAKTIDPDAGNISLALNIEDGARGEQIFNALGAGGKVVRPIETAFWGGRFGMLVDKFGNEWMLTLP